ncbi:MAG: class II aldolase/adducin family protein [Anaerolineae bacterium]|nr:class II aldolase/adducin family protein [Anaerolineae bacterium]
MKTPVEEILYFGRRMTERWINNTAGGNISVRADDEMFISPRFADYQWGWQLEPEQIVSGPIEGDALLSHPAFSREGKAHLGIYHSFPEAQAIIHAHPHFIMPFCAADKPIESTIDATDMFGTIEQADYAIPNTQELADNIVAGLRGKNKLMAEYAAAILLPRHGIFVAGKDLYAVYDTLVKINMNAWCIIAQKMLD